MQAFLADLFALPEPTFSNMYLMLQLLCMRSTRALLCTSKHATYKTRLWYADGMQNIQEGSVHEITFHMALTLANLPVRAVKLGRDNLNVDTQQGIVLASVKAFTKCFAVPGSHQHIGECTPLGTILYLGLLAPCGYVMMTLISCLCIDTRCLLKGVKCNRTTGKGYNNDSVRRLVPRSMTTWLMHCAACSTHIFTDENSRVNELNSACVVPFRSSEAQMPSCM